MNKNDNKTKMERDILLIAFRALNEILIYDVLGEKQSKYYYGVARGILDTTEMMLRRIGITEEEISGEKEGESDE